MPRPVHFDVGVKDPARAMAFYKAAFGWTSQRWEGPFEYYLITTGPTGEPGIDGGCELVAEEGAGVTLSLGVTSLEETIAAVTAAGGGVVGEISDIPGVGRMVTVEDTEGNQFGLIEEKRLDQHVKPQW